MARRKRRKYTPEQKADAVRMVREVGNLAQVARDLDLTESSLRSWVKQAEIDEGQGPEGALTSEEREELQHLLRRSWRVRTSFASGSPATRICRQLLARSPLQPSRPAGPSGRLCRPLAP